MINLEKYKEQANTLLRAIANAEAARDLRRDIPQGRGYEKERIAVDTVVDNTEDTVLMQLRLMALQNQEVIRS